MRITRILLVLFACGSMLAACGGEKKKSDGDQAVKADQAGGQGQTAAAPASPGPAAQAPAKPFGNKLAGLLGGGASEGQSGGILGGLGLGGLGQKVGEAGAAGGPGAAASDEAGAPSTIPAATPAGSPPAAQPAAPAANAPASTASGGKCVQVAEHLMKIMKKEVAAGMADVPPELAAELNKQLEGAKGQIVAECQKANWPPAVHKCLLGATDMASLTKCESMVTGGGAAEATAPSDTDWDEADLNNLPTEVEASGDAECDKLAEHVFKVMVGTASPEEREMVEAMKAMVVSELSKQCASTPWPKAARNCILKANSEAAMEQCASQHSLE